TFIWKTTCCFRARRSWKKRRSWDDTARSPQRLGGRRDLFWLTSRAGGDSEIAYSFQVIALLIVLAATASPASMPSVITVPAAARPSPQFDVNAATEAYLAEIPPASKARSDAYFEGGYWLELWNFLLDVVIALLLLYSRASAKMRDFAERITRFGPVRTAIYWAQYIIAVSILGFPLEVYEGYFREHQYGLATQTFRPWMWDQTK